jgi:hypothetical protein
MKNDPSIREKIEKLPKWAQEHIGALVRQREEAIDTLNKFTDQQTPTEVSFNEHPCTGEGAGPIQKTRYLQTNRVEFCHAGVFLEVFLTRMNDVQRGYGIELSFSPTDDHGIVALHPRGYGKIEFLAKENMP